MSSSWQGLITENNVDTSLDANSSNPVTSDAIYDALSNKANTGHEHSNINSTIIDAIYPIGSIYMTTSSTHPSTLFPNTYWDKIEGKFLMGSSSSHSLGSTGGSADAIVPYHTHTQKAHNHTQNAHDHYFYDSTLSTPVTGNIAWSYSSARNMSTNSGSYYYPYSSSNSGGLGRVNVTNSTTATNQSTTATNQSSGSSGTGKNMPPYKAVNTYERRQQLIITIDRVNTYGQGYMEVKGHLNLGKVRRVNLVNEQTNQIVDYTDTASDGYFDFIFDDIYYTGGYYLKCEEAENEEF